ncbi:MAG TPA: hypothetical protein VNO79_14140 [Actinomycetota bacterium]|nr:hypothetical protein [Actinomycetota bacterium]
MFRRKRLPEELLAPYDAFREALRHVERAKRELAAAVPTTRLPGRPLAEALLAFEDEVREAEAGMRAWRHPAVAEAWERCRSALAEVRARAERLRLEAPDPGGFEGLVGLVDDLLAPLEAFEEASVRFLDLRA